MLAGWIALAASLILAVMAARSRKHLRNANRQLMKEMEELLEAFAADLAEDRDAALRPMREALDKQEEQIRALNERNNFLEKKLYDLNQLWVEDAKPRRPRAEAEPVDRSAVRPGKVARMPTAASRKIMDRYGELLNLYKQGMTVEYIAKQLEMNKGEVQLILQLARQEAQAGL